VLIDWFTVVAQILNFLVLVFLLKYFLYDRIIAAMDERQRKIRSRLEEADRKEQEAADQKESYLQKNRQIEERKKELLAEARQKAEERQKELVAEAKEDAEALRSRWKASVRKEQDAFIRDVRQMTGQKVYALARKALKDLAEASTEERTIEVFLSKIQEVDKDERNRLLDGIRDSDNRLTVRSSFDIASGMRGKITRALREELTDDLHVDYETRPELIFGVELRLHGQKLAWNLEDYLETFEGEMRKTLEGYALEGQNAEQQSSPDQQKTRGS
jgi:F-type H+-transporting ATPase subunit b